MGKPVATYLVRITLHERDNQSIEEYKEVGGNDPIPTLDHLNTMIRNKLYDELPYFYLDGIGVSSERVDQ